MISRVFHEQSESMLVGPRSLFIVLKLNLVLAIFSVIKINAVNAQTVRPQTKSISAYYLFWAAFCEALMNLLLFSSSSNEISWLKIYNTDNSGKMQYRCCLPFSPLQMSSVASLLVACRLHQLSCTCLLRHWQNCHLNVFLDRCGSFILLCP